MKLWRYNHLIEQLGGRYTLLRPLGSGGMADVCLAWDEHDHHEVAVKVLKPEMLDSSMLQRFFHEGELVALLDHPHIIRIYGGCVEKTIQHLPLAQQRPLRK